jgi:hypothetical protein
VHRAGTKMVKCLSSVLAVTVATAAVSCNRAMVAALVFWLWGNLQRRCRGNSGLCVELDSKCCDFYYVFKFVFT